MNYLYVRARVYRILQQFEAKGHLHFSNVALRRKCYKSSLKPYIILASCFSTSPDKTFTISKDTMKQEFETYIEQNKEKLRFTERKILLRKDVILEEIRQRKNKMKEDIKHRKDKMKEDIKYKTGRMREKVEDIIERENIYTIPNLLCITRIALSPYLGMLIVQSNYHYALAVLGVAAVTDLLDGWIARKWKNQSSKVGSFLDPMADKMLIGTLFLSLTYADLIPLALTGIIITRDVVLVTAGSIIRYRSLPPPRTLSRYFDATHATAQLSPTIIGKINTAVQLLLVGSTLAAPVFHYVDHPVLQSLWYITGATTIAAGVSYAISKNTYRFLGKKVQ